MVEEALAVVVDLEEVVPEGGKGKKHLSARAAINIRNF
jgi:hypothetical protein